MPEPTLLLNRRSFSHTRFQIPMKIRFIAPVILLLLPVTAATQSMSEQQRIREEIRTEVGRLITATNYDPMATLPLYVPTSRVTSINDAQILKGGVRCASKPKHWLDRREASLSGLARST